MANFFKSVLCKVNNSVMIGALDFLRKLRHLSTKNYDEFLPENEHLFSMRKAELDSKGGFIENQNSYTDLRFGKKTIQFSGCEIIATYNAIAFLSDDTHPIISFPKLINYFEKDGMILSGLFGTSPKTINKYFIENGYSTIFSTKISDFDTIGNSYDTSIITIYNDATDITKQIHTICLTKKGGCFIAHNVYGNGMVLGPFSSVTEAIYKFNQGLSKGISIIGISKQ